MKRNLWLLLVSLLLGLALASCAAPRRAVVPTATPTVSLLATATATPTAPAATPTPTPQPIPEDAVRVNVYCNCDVQVSTGDYVAITWFWAAASEELVQSFLDTVSYEVTINGQVISNPSQFMGAVEPFERGDYDGDGENDFSARWIFGLGALAPGTHTVELTLNFSTTITDGFDLNNDGAQDQYGPGTDEYFARIVSS